MIIFATVNGGLAQLARALAWHARGHEFDSRILHDNRVSVRIPFFIYRNSNVGLFISRSIIG